MRNFTPCRRDYMRSAEKIISFASRWVPRRDYELAFLPAALEITETPPSPTRRAVGLWHGPRLVQPTSLPSRRAKLCRAVVPSLFSRSKQEWFAQFMFKMGRALRPG